jgi:hypothetical protein
MLDVNHRRHGGVFGPTELDLFERVLAKLGWDKLGEPTRSSMAQRVMANYMAGIKDESELVETSRLPLGR